MSDEETDEEDTTVWKASPPTWRADKLTDMIKKCQGALEERFTYNSRLAHRRVTSAFSSQDERIPGKEEEIGKYGTVWTVVGEEESRRRRQSQNALTEAEGATTYAKRQIQDAQTAFLCLVDDESLIPIQGCSVAEPRRVLRDDSSSDMSVDELTAFLALVYVREMKGGRNMELSSFWSE
ncbi:hypothetical protein CRENBAI_013634 [Crenichthys baileyi]|uniref:PiggyBac transposable element-derived protein domain-containing protein n=1 Tax=Crenichthys baileyi TaxID=28760 RepID=A0AAV9QPR5_9TELE